MSLAQIVTRVGRGRSRRNLATFLGGRGADCLIVAGLLGMLLATAISCEGRAQEEPVVLTIGSRQVRQGELERAFWEKQRADRSFRPDSVSLRRFLPVYLDDLIWQELARQEIPELEPVAQVRLDEFKETKMVEMLREEAYIRKARAGDAAIRAAYEDLGRLLHLRYLLVPTKEDADKALDAIRQGAVFAKVAENKSTDEGSRGQGGDIGWLDYYDVDTEIREKIFRMKPGELAGPFSWSGQWQVFQLLEEKPNPGRGTLESERARLQQGLSLAGIIAGRRAFLEELFRKYELTFDPAQVAWATAFLREKTASIPRDLSKYTAEDLEDPEFKRKYMGNPFTSNPIPPADSGRVVATFQDLEGRTQKVKPILILDQMLSDAPISWPSFETTDDVEAIIRELVLERLEAYEAQAHKIPDRPEFQRLVREREAEIRARYFYRTRLRPTAKPTPEEVKAYYDSHPEEFHTPEQRKFQALASSSLETAQKMRELFRAGKTPTEIRTALLVEDPSINGTGDAGTPLYKKGDSAALDPFLFQLPLHGVSEPIPFEGRYTVAKVMEIQPAQSISLEEAAGDLSVRLNTEKTEALLRRRIEEARPLHPVTLHEEALRGIRLARPAE